MPKLLTPMRSNAKTAKFADELRIEGAVLHLAPLGLAGCGNMCPHASPGCAAACLNTSGRSQVRGPLNPDALELHPIHRARIRRTNFLMRHTCAFDAQLRDEIAALQRRANRKGYTPAVRLNTTSDLSWECWSRFGFLQGIPTDTLMSAFPEVQFYDYTKDYYRALQATRGAGGWPSNYHLTYSRHENTRLHQMRMLWRYGASVAVVFRDRFPRVFLGQLVENGDTHDYRFLGSPAGVVGLRAKGRARADQTGFVVDVGEWE